MFWAGREPLPVWEKPGSVAIGASGRAFSTFATIRFACLAIVSGGRISISTVGTLARAVASSRKSFNVASRAVRVSLPTRTILANWFFLTAVMRSVLPNMIPP